MNSRGIYIPPLAYAILVLFIVLVVIAAIPALKNTLLEIIGAILK